MYYRAPTFIHPGAPIKLSSQPLTRVSNELDQRKEVDRKKAGDKYRRLAKLEQADNIRDQTNTSYVQPAKHATIDLSGPRVVSNTETGGNPDAEAQRRDDIERVKRGEPIVERPDIKTQMNQVAREAAAIEVIIDRLEDEFRAEFIKLSAAYCAKIRPDHDAKMKQFFKSFGECYAIFADLQKTKQDLVDSQIGFGGLFGVDLGFLNSDDIRSVFHDAKVAGFVTSVPKEFA